MGTWALFILVYAIIKGLREGIKKKAMEQSSLTEVLFFYTLVAFLLQIPFAHNLFALTPRQYFLIFVKSFIIFIAWICAFFCIHRMPVSLYCVLDQSRMLFSIGLSMVILQETLQWWQFIGVGIVIAGLLMLNRGKGGYGQRVRPLYIVLTLLSCLLNAVSGIMDKIYLRSMETSQLQFWYMLFLVVLYLAYLLATRTKVQWEKLRRNYWIPLLGLLFIIGDRALFRANADQSSSVTTMTLIKQSSVLFSILVGKMMFREKQIGYRLLCAGVVIGGILLAVL